MELTKNSIKLLGQLAKELALHGVTEYHDANIHLRLAGKATQLSQQSPLIALPPDYLSNLTAGDAHFDDSPSPQSSPLPSAEDLELELHRLGNQL